MFTEHARLAPKPGGGGSIHAQGIPRRQGVGGHFTPTEYHIPTHALIIAPCWRGCPAKPSHAQGVPHTDVAQKQPQSATRFWNYLGACDIHTHGWPQLQEVGMDMFFLRSLEVVRFAHTPKFGDELLEQLECTFTEHAWSTPTSGGSAIYSHARSTPASRGRRTLHAHNYFAATICVHVTVTRAD